MLIDLNILDLLRITTNGEMQLIVIIVITNVIGTIKKKILIENVQRSMRLENSDFSFELESLDVSCKE